MLRDAIRSAMADRLAAAIGAEADPQRLIEVGKAIARCAKSPAAADFAPLAGADNFA